jgi:hypothetical protein
MEYSHLVPGLVGPDICFIILVHGLPASSTQAPCCCCCIVLFGFGVQKRPFVSIPPISVVDASCLGLGSAGYEKRTGLVAGRCLAACGGGAYMYSRQEASILETIIMSRFNRARQSFNLSIYILSLLSLMRSFEVETIAVCIATVVDSSHWSSYRIYDANIWFLPCGDVSHE